MSLARSVVALEAAAHAILDDAAHLRTLASDTYKHVPVTRVELVAVLAAELPLLYAERGADALLRCCADRVLRAL